MLQLDLDSWLRGDDEGRRAAGTLRCLLPPRLVLGRPLALPPPHWRGSITEIQR